MRKVRVLQCRRLGCVNARGKAVPMRKPSVCKRARQGCASVQGHASVQGCSHVLGFVNACMRVYLCFSCLQFQPMHTHIDTHTHTHTHAHAHAHTHTHTHTQTHTQTHTRILTHAHTHTHTHTNITHTLLPLLHPRRSALQSFADQGIQDAKQACLGLLVEDPGWC